MSLYICGKCGHIENSSCYDRGIDKDPSFPNLHMMEMHEWPFQMLCSECNTGTWHGEFPKELPKAWEVEYGKLSKYNYITPFDHPRGSRKFYDENIKREREEWNA